MFNLLNKYYRDLCLFYLPNKCVMPIKGNSYWCPPIIITQCKMHVITYSTLQLSQAYHYVKFSLDSAGQPLGPATTSFY